MILSVVGLGTLMIVMFIVLQSYLGGQNNQRINDNAQEAEVMSQPVELSETLLVRIEKIEDNHIIGYDLHNKKDFNKVIGESVTISDAYGNVLPMSQIKTGDIVEVDYQNQKNKVISMSKSSSVHSWNKISGITVDRESKQVNIAGTTYRYTERVLVVDSKGTLSDITKVGPFDIVSIQAVDDTVWSITIEEASASLNLVELPTSNGQIEIDNSRLLMFKDVKEPIKLIPGKHKIIIKMRGYVTIIKDELIVEAGQTYEMSLKDAEIAYTEIKPYISAATTDYTIKVGDKTYGPGESIKVQQGDYRVEINAEGYEKWVRNVSLEKETYNLRAALVAIKPEVTEDTEGTTDTNQTSQNIEGTDSIPDTNNTSNASQRITINTEPTGVNVYIDGVLKGVTPYTATLNNGTYGILLEQTGYDVYSTNIILDGSENQTSYLYKLNPRT